MKARVRKLVCHSSGRWGVTDLERALNVRHTGERRAVRRAVRELLDQGVLQYTYRLGCSFLEPSVQGLVRISPRLVLKPPQWAYSPAPDETVVTLAPGSAFGLGDHASTRLALAGIERAVRAHPGLKTWTTPSMLDIGTGSGVLMIAAVHLGFHRAIGIERDPCARYEARQNLRINGIEDRAAVSEAPVEAQTGPFALVAANLRFPSICSLVPRIRSLTGAGGAVVVSGIREAECQKLTSLLGRSPFALQWKACDQGWCGALFVKAGM